MRLLGMLFLLFSCVFGRGITLTDVGALAQRHPKSYTFVVAVPSPGHLGQLLEIAKSLAKEGHNIVVGFFRVPHPTFDNLAQDFVERILNTGFDIFEVPTTLTLDDQVKPTGSPMDLLKVVNFFSKMNNDIYRGFSPVIKAHPPSLIIYEEFSPLAGHLAGYDIPAVVLTPHLDLGFASGFNEPYTYPSFAAKEPTTNFPDRLINLIMRTLFDNGVYYGWKETRESCAAWDLPDAPCHDWLATSSMYGHLVLVVSQYPILFPFPVSPHVHLVGPQVSESNVTDPKLEEWMNGKSIILVSMGSDMTLNKTASIQFIETLTNVATKQDMYILWARGKDMIEDYDLPDPGSRFYLGDFIPQKFVLAHPSVKAMVSHCGTTGLGEAFYFGVPVIGLPLGRDQPLLAHRISRAGYSITLNKDDLSPKTNEQSIINWLTDPTITTRANEVKAMTRSNGGLKRSLELINSLMETKNLRYTVAAHSSHNWFARHSIDTIGSIFGFFGGLFFFLYQVLKFFLRILPCCGGAKKEPTKLKQQ